MLAYNRGSVVMWYAVAEVVASIPAFVYFVPLLQRLQMPSVYTVSQQLAAAVDAGVAGVAGSCLCLSPSRFCLLKLTPGWENFR